MAQIKVFFNITDEEADRIRKEIEKDLELSSKKSSNKANQQNSLKSVKKEKQTELEKQLVPIPLESCALPKLAVDNTTETTANSKAIEPPKEVPYPCAIMEMNSLSKKIMETNDPNELREYVDELKRVSTSNVVTRLCSEFLIGDALRVEIHDEVQSILRREKFKADVKNLAKRYNCKVVSVDAILY